MSFRDCACMHMYTNKQLCSVIASLAPSKERFRPSAGCNTKEYLGDRASTHRNGDQNLRKSGLELYNGREVAAMTPASIRC